MEIEEIEKNFELIKEFNIEQEKQKKRGLNNYNILTSVLKKTDEVRLHSRMLFSLLNPSGLHYQADLFLEIFLKILDVKGFSFNTKNCSVYKEWKNIDLYLTDGNSHIIIENKVHTGDREKQIKRYIEVLKENKGEISPENTLVVYLSIDRSEPSSYSLEDLKIDGSFIKKGLENITLFKSIHYKKEILDWLKKSQYEVQNITNLNEVFNQYIDVVNMLNNQYKSKVMNLSDLIKNDNSIFKMAKEISKALPEAKIQIQTNFWNELQRQLAEKEKEVITYSQNKDKKIGSLVSNYYGNGNKSKHFGLKYKITDYNESSIWGYINLYGAIHYGARLENSNGVVINAKALKSGLRDNDVDKALEPLQGGNADADGDDKWIVCHYNKGMRNPITFSNFNPKAQLMCDNKDLKRIVKELVDHLENSVELKIKELLNKI